MKIVADERVAALDETFARHGEVLRLSGQEIENSHLRDASALITRTVTRVDRRLLEGTGVRFVGTATIGFDHLDTAFLDDRGISWANAPGCNANATAQYTVAMYLLACRRLHLDPLSLRYGVVGRGNVGSRLIQILDALGVEAIACDPPLAAAGESRLHSMDAILETDVFSLHVPLTRSGPWPTFHMIHAVTLSRLSPDALLINSARGDVVDGPSLKDWMARGGRAALDVWPSEPDFDPAIIDRSIVASPHVAGYSIDGKKRASAMIYQAFCECFGLQAEDGGEMVSSPGEPRQKGRGLANAIAKAIPVEHEDAAMRALLGLPRAEFRKAFHSLRSNYALRQDLIL